MIMIMFPIMKMIVMMMLLMQMMMVLAPALALMLVLGHAVGNVESSKLSVVNSGWQGVTQNGLMCSRHAAQVEVYRCRPRGRLAKLCVALLSVLLTWLFCLSASRDTRWSSCRSLWARRVELDRTVVVTCAFRALALKLHSRCQVCA